MCTVPCSPKDVNYLSSEEVSTALTIPKEDGIVWQVATRKLRVWSAASSTPEGQEPTPVRPYFTVLLQLSPSTEVLTYKMFFPSEHLPDPRSQLQWLLENMRHPTSASALASSGAPAPVRPAFRPEKVVFTTIVEAAHCHQSLASIGIDCAVWKPLEALDALTAKYSQTLVDVDAATITGASNRPGLLRGDGVTKGIFARFWSTSQWFFQHTPWRGTPERMTFRITFAEPATLAGVRVPAGTVWMTVMGRTAEEAQMEAQGTGDDADMEQRMGARRGEAPPTWVHGSRPGDVRGRPFDAQFGTRGVSLFWSRWDAEQRLVGHLDKEMSERLAQLRQLQAEERKWKEGPGAAEAEAETGESSSGGAFGASMVRFGRLAKIAELKAALRGVAVVDQDVLALATPHPMDLVCGRPACDVSGQDSSVRMKRCVRCRRTYYCSKECQAEHWPEHKKQCRRAAAQRKPGEVVWGARETAMLFSEALHMPFDDLDAAEALKLRPADSQSFPMATTMRSGKPDRPSAEELLLLTRCMLVVGQVCASIPERMGCFLASAGGVSVPLTSTLDASDDAALSEEELQFCYRTAGAGLHAVNARGCVELPAELEVNVAVPPRVGAEGDAGTALVQLDPMSTLGERLDMLQNARELQEHLAQQSATSGAAGETAAPGAGSASA